MELTPEQIKELPYTERYELFKAELDLIPLVHWDEFEAAAEALRRKWRV